MWGLYSQPALKKLLFHGLAANPCLHLKVFSWYHAIFSFDLKTRSEKKQVYVFHWESWNQDYEMLWYDLKTTLVTFTCNDNCKVRWAIHAATDCTACMCRNFSLTTLKIKSDTVFGCWMNFKISDLLFFFSNNCCLFHHHLPKTKVPNFLYSLWLCKILLHCA